jgi:hypothetical protein
MWADFTISQFDGIILYPTNQFGGHVIDRDIVWMTVSSIVDTQDYPFRNIGNFQHDTFPLNKPSIADTMKKLS